MPSHTFLRNLITGACQNNPFIILFRALVIILVLSNKMSHNITTEASHELTHIMEEIDIVLEWLWVLQICMQLPLLICCAAVCIETNLQPNIPFSCPLERTVMACPSASCLEDIYFEEAFWNILFGSWENCMDTRLQNVCTVGSAQSQIWQHFQMYTLAAKKTKIFVVQMLLPQTLLAYSL